MFRRRSVPSGNGKVIQLERFLDGVSLSPIRQIEAYWTALREDGGIPMRSQIDPRGMSSTLEYTFILERIAPGMARFRIAGQHLCGLAGMEVRGMPLTAFFTPVARPEVSATLETVFDRPAVAELDLRGEVARTGAPSTSARMLMMPLRSDFGRVDRILGAMMSTERGRPARTPVRFEISSARLRNIDGAPGGIERADAPPESGAPNTAFPPGFGEPSVEFGEAPRPRPVDAETPVPARPRGPAWEDPALSTPAPADRFGHRDRPADMPATESATVDDTRAHAPREPEPRPAQPRAARGVPYLRLVKTDD
ncbi:PAS domain-containing protein [Marinibacterium sp. SX1]|uniref:PAS domain-containing protein n=1 Tax=Marinibacterium sp. SX1 TaxID=3388424 RepID=UPI003D16BDBB